MARPEVTGRRKEATAAAEVEIAPKKKKKKPAPVVLVPNAEAFSIPEFCAAHRIAKACITKSAPPVRDRARHALSLKSSSPKKRLPIGAAIERPQKQHNINKRPTISLMAGRSDFHFTPSPLI